MVQVQVIETAAERLGDWLPQRIGGGATARGRAAADALRQPVTQALRSRLDDLDLHHPPRLKVRVTSRSR